MFLYNTPMKMTFALFILFVTGCAIYQSEGREFLEKQGLEFAGVLSQQTLQQKLYGCQWESRKSLTLDEAIALPLDPDFPQWRAFHLQQQSKQETLILNNETLPQESFVCTLGS